MSLRNGSVKQLELRQRNALKLENLRLLQQLETSEAQIKSLRAILYNLQIEVNDLRSRR